MRLELGFVYLLLILPAFRLKIGKTGNLLKRREDIQDSINESKGIVFPQLVIPIMVIFWFDYHSIEEDLHNFFSFANYTWLGSGKTEYFRFILLPFIWVTMLFIQIWKPVRIFILVGFLLHLVEKM